MPKRRKPGRKRGRYRALLEKIFLDRYCAGTKEIAFDRSELVTAGKKLKIAVPKNLGDVIYSFRYRAKPPARIAETQPKGREWIIEGRGKARYAFRLTKLNRIFPNPNVVTIKIPNSTPEIVSAYKLSDEQALLAVVRYNRLIDVFLGISVYSLQSHLRTTVTEIGQIEVDEVYVGVDGHGRQYAIPVQAKGGTDKLAATQIKQDIAFCDEAFPHLICRAVSAQFMAPDLVALFELTLKRGTITIVQEAHYQLVPSSQISSDELSSYQKLSTS